MYSVRLSVVLSLASSCALCTVVPIRRGLHRCPRIFLSPRDLYNIVCMTRARVPVRCLWELLLIIIVIYLYSDAHYIVSGGERRASQKRLERDAERRSTRVDQERADGGEWDGWRRAAQNGFGVTDATARRRDWGVRIRVCLCAYKQAASFCRLFRPY